jgi:uroporphyrinogen-III decarboxylase
MNSRERIQKTVNFEPTDKVAIDLGATRASGINASAYDKLKKKLGINTPTKIQDAMSVLAEVEFEVLDRIYADVVPLDTIGYNWVDNSIELGVRKKLFCGLETYFPPGTNITADQQGNWLLLDENGNPFGKMPKNGHYFDFIETSPSGKIEPDKFNPSSDIPDEVLSFMQERSKYLFENTEKALLGWGGCLSILGMSAMLGDNITQGHPDQWLCMLLLEKETANEMMGLCAEATIKKLKLLHEAVGDRCFAWGVISDDSGTQQSGVISPDVFDEMIKPHYKTVCDWVHQNTNWKTFLHSCGSVYDYLPYWIEAGVDIFNPVQISARNMKPEKLVDEFGDKIVFWGGGCDTQYILPFADKDAVKEHVRENLTAFKRCSGFVFSQVHNIQQDVPVENILAMYEAVEKYGGRKL